MDMILVWVWIDLLFEDRFVLFVKGGVGFEFDIMCDWELEVVWVMAYVIKMDLEWWVCVGSIRK